MRRCHIPNTGASDHESATPAYPSQMPNQHRSVGGVTVPSTATSAATVRGGGTPLSGFSSHCPSTWANCQDPVSDPHSAAGCITRPFACATVAHRTDSPRYDAGWTTRAYRGNDTASSERTSYVNDQSASINQSAGADDGAGSKAAVSVSRSTR